MLILFFLNPSHQIKYSSYLSLFIFLNVYYLLILYYFDLKSYLKDYIRVTGGDNDQSEEISNNKLLEAILDIQKNLDKNTNSFKQIANSLEEIR